jgi:ankyrin repeat protein
MDERMLNAQLIEQCRVGSVDVVRRLLDDKADINAVVGEYSPLLLAVEANNKELLIVLLHAGADVSRVFSRQMTILMIAAQCGYLEIVHCLLQHQPAALLDTRDKYGCTALYVAIQADKPDAASTLMDAGADASVPNNFGQTTLMACSDVALAERLLDKGVNIHAKDIEGMDAFLRACLMGNMDMAVMLMSRGASIYTRDRWNMTALDHACRQKHVELMMMMIGKKPDNEAGVVEWMDWLQTVDDDGATVLHLAVQGDHVSVVQALVDAGFDVNTRDGDGSPALHDANSVEMARILLDAGAEDLRSRKGRTAIAFACQMMDRAEVLRLLLQRFPDTGNLKHSLLIDAILDTNLEVVRLVLAARPGYINKQDSYGCTALHYASHPETVQLLLELSAGPALEDNAENPAPVCSATRVRELKAAQDLIGMKDIEGRTALMHFSCPQSMYQYDAMKELFRYCEEHGLDTGVNNKDNNGDIALHLAVLANNLSLVELLLEKGAEVMGSGLEGTTVLMKPFLNPDDLSTYSRLLIDECITVCDSFDVRVPGLFETLMSAVLRNGSGEADVAVGVGGAAETAEEPAAKRRRMNKTINLI